MVADQTIRTIYARYFDEATLKRMFRQGPGPLLAALSAPDD
jgi:polar amino acid transport system substrate-binding protein